MSDKRHIFFSVKATVTVGLLGWLFMKVDWLAIGRLVCQARWEWLLLALALPALSLPLLAIRWRLILARLQLSLTHRQALGITLTAQFFNSMLPGATGGDIYKIYSACHTFREHKPHAVSSVVLDRFSALLALLVVGGISFLSLRSLWLSLLTGLSFQLSSTSITIGVLSLLAGVTLLLALRRFSAKFVHAWHALRLSIKHARFHAPTVFMPLVAISLIIHLINFTGAYSIARALSIEVSYLQMLALMPILLLVIMLPLSINGHGIREFVIIGYFTLIHVYSPIGGSARDLSIAFSLLYVTLDFCWCLPGAVRYLCIRRGAPLASRGLDDDLAASAR